MHATNRKTRTVRKKTGVSSFHADYGSLPNCNCPHQKESLTMLFVPNVEYNIIRYTDSEGLCVCCDGCDRWFNVECTTIKKKKLSDVYFYEESYTS